MGVLFSMLVFLLSHILVSRSRLKPWTIQKIGQSGYLAVYSILSLALFAWVVFEVLSAERDVLWLTPAWAYGFATLISGIGFVLIGIGATTHNPFSISFRSGDFDPTALGVVAWIRHPVLWGLTLWGIAHIPANGEWPTLILFAGSAMFGLVGVPAVERRQRKRFSPERWTALRAAPGQFDARARLGATVGTAMWAGFLYLHPVLFGVDPLASFYRA